jgi:hypothetical protein
VDLKAIKNNKKKVILEEQQWLQLKIN